MVLSLSLSLSLSLCHRVYVSAIARTLCSSDIAMVLQRRDSVISNRRKTVTGKKRAIERWKIGARLTEIVRRSDRLIIRQSDAWNLIFIAEIMVHRRSIFHATELRWLLAD